MFTFTWWSQREDSQIITVARQVHAGEDISSAMVVPVHLGF